jgi:Fe-S cluster assembly protein SufD
MTLTRALAEHTAQVEAHLGRHASCDQEPFTALNTAFMQDGAFIYLPRNAIVEGPIHLLFFSTGREEPTVAHPRVLVVAEPGSQAQIIESYAGLAEALYFTNAVTEIAAGEGAVIDHYKIQRESRQAFHVSDLRVREARDVRFRSTCFTLGGRLVRNHAHTALHGEGIDSTLNGLYLTDGRQHVDNHTLIEHLQPRCASHEYYKGILGGGSTGVFRGQILVHQAAQKTDAYQANRNLLLSDEADIDTKPQLEIHADDVKCSHGSTVGQLDQDAIFYLRSRGIDAEEATRILTRAFAGEIVARVRIEAVREQLDRLVSDRLAGTARSR